MKMNADYPKIRYLDTILLKDNLICLRDPAGFSDKVLVLSPPLLYVCTLFDGKHTLTEIEQAFKQQYGQPITPGNLQELITKLDSCLFLDNEAFGKAKEQAVRSFKNATLRKSAFAGQAYEAEPKSLCTQLSSYFTHKAGPGALDSTLDTSQGEPAAGTGKLRGIIAPHIDLQRGGHCFAWSYSTLAQYTAAKTFILLGISHAETTRRYVLTRKNFETPLGTITTDNQFIDRLEQKCSHDFFYDEFVHRNEHSLEFQTLFLRYLYPADLDIKIVPILCSSFYTLIGSDKSPLEQPEIREFIEALRQTVAESPEEVCFIAGVDLSHIGQKFGHNLTLTPAILKKARADDKLMFKSILEMDGEEFFRFIQHEKDQRNVCGVSAIYTLLKALPAGTARLLKYDMAVDKDTQSLVSFAAAAFFE